jgi:hypothetical protein
MPKRTVTYPMRISKGEQKMNSNKQYDKYIKHPSKINPVFLENHYEVEGKK